MTRFVYVRYTACVNRWKKISTDIQTQYLQVLFPATSIFRTTVPLSLVPLYMYPFADTERTCLYSGLIKTSRNAVVLIPRKYYDSCLLLYHACIYHQYTSRRRCIVACTGADSDEKGEEKVQRSDKERNMN